ncbi:MAG: alpha/beta fold hydrolase [Betaproteobacteria bacterium]|nr:alpha/beta fold hydrolase [Betaproteobacteria bacterium]
MTLRPTLRSLLGFACVAAALTAHGAPTARTIAEFPEKFPYRAYDTADALGRTIHFYLTDADARDDRPLILVLQGSGCSSNFTLREGQVGAGWHTFVRRADKNRAQVLVVEKPGVTLFDRPANPGGAVDCSAEFRREQTGERWLAALTAAMSAAIELRGATPKTLLVIGHSEGAVFAPRLALLDKRVTHVASLAATPVSQLHDFFDMATSGEGFIAKRPGGKREHIDRVLDAWQAVSTEPDSEVKQVFGHAHRYWADKFAPFDFSKLAVTSAKFFVAYGDRDENSSPRTMDAFAIELLIRHRDLTWLRIEGADHGFAQPGGPSGSGMAPVIEQAVAWFYGEAFDRKSVLWPRSGAALSPATSTP